MPVTLHLVRPPSVIARESGAMPSMVRVDDLREEFAATGIHATRSVGKRKTLQRSIPHSQSGNRVSETADITVLIVAYKSADTISRCLADLAGQTRQPREVIVLENGSPPGQRVRPEDLPAGMRLVDGDQNIGFAAGNNRIAELASSTWIALLNPDAFAHADWIEKFEQACLDYPTTSVFGSTQLAAGRPGILDGCGDCYHALGLPYRSGYGRSRAKISEGEVFAACGAATFIRRDLFQELGGFDERFFCYCEDVDLGYRARLLGYETVQLRDAIVDHVGYGSSGRRSEFATYHGVRNRLWVFVKNTPGWLFWALLPGHVVVTILLWASSWRFGHGRVFLRAILHALARRHEMMVSRKQIQAGRRVSISAIAAMMNWNPLDLVTRRPKIRPAKESRG
jgi:N-acetylglucosaminyl-diphospho-decaprenol L-rhamnosyltransferase